MDHKQLNNDSKSKLTNEEENAEIAEVKHIIKSEKNCNHDHIKFLIQGLSETNGLLRRSYSKELRKLQGKVVKDWMTKAKAGVIDFFDLVRGFQHGNMSRAYPYEVEFLQSVLTKDKIVDRFRKYFGGKKAMNNRTASKK